MPEPDRRSKRGSSGTADVRFEERGINKSGRAIGVGDLFVVDDFEWGFSPPIWVMRFPTSEG